MRTEPPDWLAVGSERPGAHGPPDGGLGVMSGTYHVPMSQELDGKLSPTPQYYEIRGRAAEIARAFGSPVGGAEHLFLAMLHDGGWPVSVISPLLELGRAEAAVSGILSSSGYSPPSPPRFLMRDGCVQMWGAEVAFELGDSYLGVEHALLAMIRMRDTVPARALADLADLDALEAAVLEAKNAPPGGPPEDAVFLPEGQEMDGPLRRALGDALPEGTTFGFSGDEDERTWMHVIGPGDSTDPVVTREVLNTALASLNRRTLGG
jgi:Clp amino terminal domain, pathogenicity island component